jgi:hypothetical protein
MPHPRRSAASAFLLVTVAVARAQGDVLDQSYLPAALTNGLEVTASQPVTQTFTVGITGQLTRIELARIAQHRGTPTQPLQVDLVTTAGGVPTTTVLASVTVQPASVPSSIGPLQLDLRPFAVQVQQGQVLGIALSSNAVPGTQTYAWWGEAPNSTYANGQVFIQLTAPLPAWDLAFQTWVAPVASTTGYGAGFAGTNGVPSLAASSLPHLGTTPLLLLGNSAGTSTFGALFFGLQRANQPTPFGGTALVQVAASATLSLPPAGGSLPFAIPFVPAFLGTIVDVQGALLDAGAAQGIAFTAGLELLIGP